MSAVSSPCDTCTVESVSTLTGKIEISADAVKGTSQPLSDFSPVKMPNNKAGNSSPKTGIGDAHHLIETVRDE